MSDENEKKQIVLKLDLNEEFDTLLHRGLNSQIVAGAVNLIMAELTPENVRAFVHELLLRSMKDFSTYEVERAIKTNATKMMAGVLERPEYQKLIAEKVKEAVDTTIVGLGDIVKNQLAAAVEEGMTNWARRQR